MAHAVTAVRPEGVSGLLCPCPFWKSDSAALEFAAPTPQRSCPEHGSGPDDTKQDAAPALTALSISFTISNPITLGGSSRVSPLPPPSPRSWGRGPRMGLLPLKRYQGV